MSEPRRNRRGGAGWMLTKNTAPRTGSWHVTVVEPRDLAADVKRLQERTARVDAVVDSYMRPPALAADDAAGAVTRELRAAEIAQAGSAEAVAAVETAPDAQPLADPVLVMQLRQTAAAFDLGGGLVEFKNDAEYLVNEWATMRHPSFLAVSRMLGDAGADVLAGQTMKARGF